MQKKKISWVFRLTSTRGKQRFPLAAFNRLKKERTQAIPWQQKPGKTRVIPWFKPG